MMEDTDSRHTVLIVDDAPENLQVLSHILYEHGINISVAESGREALELVVHKPPDLILLDILMPEMDGYEVCARLKQEPATKNISVIFLTAKNQMCDIVKGFECGAVDYVTKPFNPPELLARVLTHLELKRSRDIITAQNRQLAEQNIQLDLKNKELQEFYALKSQQREQQYRLLAEQVADGIGILQQGKLVFVNEALASMLGFTARQLLGNSLIDLVHEDYRAEMQQTYEQLEAGNEDEQWQLLQCVIRGDGREIWIEGRHSRIEWEDNPAILVSMRDISHHKLRELEIEQEKEHLRAENLQLKSAMKDRYRFGDLVGKSAAMQVVYEQILDAAATDANVIVYGESGTGKELIAKTIHQLSNRQPHRFVPVNCSAIPKDLFESEFFGHKKGAFTGAYRDKEGFFDLARGGSLFLDELETLNPAMQAKLLRVIEGGGYMPVGGGKLRKTDTRIIAATNKELTQLVRQGLMREDFFYRLYVIAMTVPPLRERREDIPLLVDHFLRFYSADDQPSTLSGKMLRALYDYDWPGNVRELQNTIQRFLTTKRLDFIDAYGRGQVYSEGEPDVEVEQDDMDLQQALDAWEKQFLIKALSKNNWHRGNTAQHLNITERTLYRKMQKYSLKESH